MTRTIGRKTATLGAAALTAVTALASFALIDQNAGAQQESPAEAVPAQDCGAGDYNAVVEGSGGSYSTTNGGEEVYSGGDYREAIQAGIGSLTPGRGQQESVVVHASGGIGTGVIDLPSRTSLSVCGTIDVGNAPGRGSIEATDAEDVSVPHLNMTGSPYFGLRFHGMDGLHLGQIDLNLSGGLGIRFDRDEPGSTDVTMDDVFVSGTDNHGVETWNVDGLEIGTITARDVAYAGLLLNNTRNARIGTVDGENVATGTGYATFRMANENGNLGGGNYSTNIEVDNVISRGGGRGVFCVSQSGGALIRNVDLADNGNNSILIENCYGVTIEGGTVEGGGEVRIAARSEFSNTRDVSITLEVDGTSVRESPCGENIEWNISGNASVDVC
ncbi:right-handed parallel beta-helix repeat-containing protein [Glycomyces sp. L485]|uniref:right-handed parallel beta-helix repeat-containing protein n=1 Tax=Glycomyces sp. L485 TaxID=2909235 RepID=UPI001F4B8C83|nr:right-handed parallel beta-helix repeat-containing protein [Glycomyces sp. L485]MCH7232422.1 right-handed parallel beta-helix repeat-containing protein [Glycomyces sp. L485]